MVLSGEQRKTMAEDEARQPQPEETPEQNTPTTPGSEVRVLSPTQMQSIRILRGTIRVLEGWLEKLEQEPTTESVTPLPFSVLDGLLGLWSSTLQKVRSLLPASISRQLPDWGLTGAIASLLVVLIWGATNLFPGKPAPEVAFNPSPAPTPVPGVPIEPVVPPVESIPEPSPEPTPEAPEATETPETPSEPLETPEPSPEPVTEPLPEVETVPVPELTAPSEPETVEVTTPPPILTPEQRLIATVQSRVAEITQTYADGLIAKVQANFAQGVLVVQIKDGWYDLAAKKQDQLAKDMLGRSRDLDFSKLTLINQRGEMVARSPVVGENMIILQRRLNGADPME